MIQEHPITPPPELVKQWATANGTVYKDLSVFCQNIANEAARWGADAELEECCEWLSQFDYHDYSYGDKLQAARRGRTIPPSLKEQALIVLEDASDRLDAAHENILRRALESLPD